MEIKCLEQVNKTQHYLLYLLLFGSQCPSSPHNYYCIALLLYIDMYTLYSVIIFYISLIYFVLILYLPHIYLLKHSI